MDIYQQLKADHDRQRNLMDAVVEPCADLEARRRLFHDLCAELDAHAAAEEQSYYAALLTQSRDHERTRRSVADHDALAALVVELASGGLDGSEWTARFDALRDQLHRHLDEEETDGFALARRHLDDERARSLGERFAELKAAELGEASPSRPHCCPSSTTLQASAPCRWRASGSDIRGAPCPKQKRASPLEKARWS